MDSDFNALFRPTKVTKGIRKLKVLKPPVLGV